MRGRPPKATVLHVLEGTLNATRHKNREHEPKPQGELMGAPDWMDDEHQAVWREQPRACPAGLLKRLDRKVMAAWTRAAVAPARPPARRGSSAPGAATAKS